jgi:NTE family protein
VWHDRSLEPPEWDKEIAAPFRAFTTRNFSTWPVLKGWLLRWTNAGVEELADRLRERLEIRDGVADLPAQPGFMFCATDLVAGDDWIFDAALEGEWDVATAAAISSCHPVYFRPYTRKTPQEIALVDGGVDDDRGIEPVWRTHRTLLVSDGGDALRPQWGESLFWSLFRSASVLWDRSQIVQKRWLMSSFAAGRLDGACWSIGGSPWNYRREPELRASVADPNPPLPGYSPALARDVIATIRTDYDAFSDAEAAVLENHGYLMTEAAMRCVGIEGRVHAPVRIPHPAWLGERKVREALKDSARQRFFGRFRPAAY